MYKATGDAAHYLPRTGSHSTKGARNGRVDVLPPEAQDAELVYLDCVEQVTSLVAEQAALEKECGKLNVLLSHKLPYHEFQDAQRRRDAAGSRQAKIQELLRDAKEIGRAAGAESYAATFMQVAKMRLSPEAKRIVFDETDALLGHQFCQGLKMTDAQRHTSDYRKARMKAKGLARKHRLSNDRLLVRMQSDKDFEPSRSSPFSRPSIDEGRVAELTEVMKEVRQVSLDEQIDYVQKQLSRCESIRNHLAQKGRPVERSQGLWRALIVNRAIVGVLRSLTNIGK